MTPQNNTYLNLGLTRSQYVMAHQWVTREYGKAAICEQCARLDATRYEWSNISKKYKRERSDWRMLCTTCHRKADFTENQKRAISLRSSIAVNQYDSSRKLVQRWSSAKVASEVTGISRTAIHNNLSGRSTNAGGYVWSKA